jgi:AraC family transcriptional regulator, positive regulator of tynA and feaB
MQTSSTVALSAGISPLKCMSTAGVKPADRREFWETYAGRLCSSFDLDLPSDEIFDASVNYTNVADLVFCRLSAPVAHRVVHSAPLVRRDDRDVVKAMFQTEGTSFVEQDGRIARLQPGDWTIYETSRPSSTMVPGRAGMLFLIIPREKFLTRNFDLRNLVARRFASSHGLGKLIWSLVSATFDQAPEIRNRSGQDVADIVVQMTRLALLESADENAWADSKETIQERVKRYISSHLRDPDLSITKLADSTQCTKRYLHMAFHSEKISISDYILKLRLDRCREDLLNSAFARRSITDIAYSWGFNNSNHFSRCFKQQFGVSPRHLRTELARWPSETAAKSPKTS